MKRTTLALDEDLQRQLKVMAARQGKTLAALVNELLRHSLALGSKGRGYKLRLDGWEGELLPGVDILDRDKLFDLMNGR
jgi:plasmid stability protein